MLILKNIFFLLLFVGFIACSPPTPVNDEAHQEAVELTETMLLSHAGMKERLEFLQTENKEFKQKIKALDHADASLEETAALQDSLIEQFEDMYKEQKKLIDENEDYIKKHERKSLDAGIIAEQHRRIRSNYEQLQLQAAAIVQEVENIKIRIDGAALKLEGQ